MKLSDLPARELARLDAICLEYESRVRAILHSHQPTEQVRDEIDSLVDRYGGEHGELLRRELEGIWTELQDPQSGGSSVHGDHATPAGIHEAPTQAVSGLQNGSPVASPLAAPADDLPALGQTIGPYLLVSVLGQGGMGIVYRATDTRLDRSVAIKMLSLDERQSESLIERFQREAKAVAGLTHSHIVELFDIGVFHGMPYVVMEHLKGETLAQHIHEGRTANQLLPPQQIRQWGIQLADALMTAHAGGVIHRDIKPENIMVVGSNSNVSLKLFDFGLSRFGSTNPLDLPVPPAPADDSTPSGSSRLSGSGSATRIGAILGTPGYMAPEQARGGAITPAADVFSLGCVLFETLFGRPAFPGNTATKRFSAVLERQPLPDPARRRDDVALADLILKMLSKAPAARPSAAEVASTLRLGAERPSRSQEHNGATLVLDSIDQGAVVISRRRVVELLGGALAGGLIGATLMPGSAGRSLRSIHSIGVLRFQNSAVLPTADSPAPAADRQLDEGELLSGLLVNELSRVEGITVPKYVPITATQPAEFREAAKLLEVDALVTGTYTLQQDPVTGSGASDGSGGSSRRIMIVQLQIISGATGKLMQGMTIPTAAGDNLIEQTALAGELADVIGKKLSQSEEQFEIHDPNAFKCLVRGRTLSDPGSVTGMEAALACFQNAARVDVNFAGAHAGVALTAISLAAREDDERARELIALSQEASARALTLSPENRDALLAGAMLSYQVLADFDAADATLRDLVRTSPNHWQVHQQAGWLKLIAMEESQGMEYMRRATGLHPASRFLKADLARAEWFRGNADRAIQSATGLLAGEANTSNKANTPNDEQHESYARGLLIDIYEYSGNFAAAAALDPALSWKAGDERNAYFAAREQRLVDIPYGPYGPTLNTALLQVRRTDVAEREAPENLLARLIAAQLPMLPLVLCKHPGMISMTLLEQASETYSVLRS